MMSPSAARAARGLPWLVVAGVLVAALSLRGPIVAPTPVLRDIAADLGVGSATVALLTTAPVLTFAILTPLAALVIRRAGAEIALLLSLSGVLVGTFVRALPGFGWMLAGMVVIGAAITLGNVVVPVIIRRDVAPERVGIVTAGYVAMLNAGSLITSLLTAPLADAVGWTWALVFWSALTLGGILLWSVHLRRSGARGTESGEPAPRTAPGDLDPDTLTGPLPVVTAGTSFLRRPVVWLLLAAFSCQAAIYYGLTTWLPALTSDVLGYDRAEAGAVASVFQGVAVAGAFLVPLLTRYTPPVVPTLVIAGSWVALTLGMLLAPQAVLLWLSIGAVAHAGGFVVVFTLLVLVARSDREAAGMSALVQGCGYVLGAVSAPIIGALRDASGGWGAPLTVLVVVSLVYTVLLLAASSAAARARG